MATRTNKSTAAETVIDVEAVEAELTTEQKLEQARAEHKARKAEKKAEKKAAPVAATPTPEHAWVKPVIKGLATIAIAVGAGVLAAPLIASASAAAVTFTGWAFMHWVITIVGWLISLIAAHFATTLSIMGYGWVASRFVTPTLSVA